MVDVDAHSEFKSVRAMRGREARTLAKWQNEGWEVSRNARAGYRGQR